MSRDEEKELLIKAHTEIDQTLERMKTWRARVNTILNEIDEDIEAMAQLKGEIEEMDAKASLEIDELTLAKSQDEYRMLAEAGK